MFHNYLQNSSSQELGFTLTVTLPHFPPHTQVQPLRAWLSVLKIQFHVVLPQLSSHLNLTTQNVPN